MMTQCQFPFSPSRVCPFRAKSFMCVCDITGQQFLSGGAAHDININWDNLKRLRNHTHVPDYTIKLTNEERGERKTMIFFNLIHHNAFLKIYPAMVNSPARRNFTQNSLVHRKSSSFPHTDDSGVLLCLICWPSPRPFLLCIMLHSNSSLPLMSDAMRFIWRAQHCWWNSTEAIIITRASWNINSSLNIFDIGMRRLMNGSIRSSSPTNSQKAQIKLFSYFSPFGPFYIFGQKAKILRM